MPKCHKCVWRFKISRFYSYNTRRSEKGVCECQNVTSEFGDSRFQDFIHIHVIPEDQKKEYVNAKMSQVNFEIQEFKILFI